MKKRILAWVLALVMIVGLLPTITLAADLSGSGTKDAPYLIATANDLVTFRELVNGAGAGKTSTLYAKLTDNIDLSGQTNWTPIGKAFGGPYSSPVKYAGTFDGNGHKVTNLTINSDQKCLALFGYVNGGTIKNLTVSGSVTATASSTPYVPTRRSSDLLFRTLGARAAQSRVAPTRAQSLVLAVTLAALPERQAP